MKITDLEVIPFNIPYFKPLKWGVAGYLEAAEHVLVRIHTDQGLVGIAEATPRPTIYGESQKSIHFAISQWFKPMLMGQDPFDLEAIWRQLETIYWNPTAKGALDLALHDIQAQAAGVPAYKFLGGYANQVPLTWMLGMNDFEAMVDEAVEKIGQGFKGLKVKVGNNPAQDLRLFKTLREKLGDEVLLYVDANQAYSTQDAIHTLKAMQDYGLAMAEEPLPVWDWRGRLKLAQSLEVPVMGDESVFTVHDVVREIDLGVLGVIMIKTPRTGYYQSRKIVQMAQLAGISCLMGTQAESTVGTLPSAHFSAAFANMAYPSEISLYLALTDSLIQEPIHLEDGVLQLPETPGFGNAIDEDKLQKYRVDI